MARAVLDDPFYYLANFTFVLDWLSARYDDVQRPDERAFIQDFAHWPTPSQALFVRMAMRKGDHFRLEKLAYEEIGDSRAALAPLLASPWVTDAAPLGVSALARLLSKDDVAVLARRAGLPVKAKAIMVEALAAHYEGIEQPVHAWHVLDDEVISLTCTALLERFRLMFFGNLRQNWSEFVLAELGINQFEPVELSGSARPFQQAEDIDLYMALSTLRDRLEAGEAPRDLLADVPALPENNAWLEARRDRLLYALGRQAERVRDTETARVAFKHSGALDARMRRIRLLEKSHPEDAWALCEAALKAIESEAEAQQLARVRPRLARKLGYAPVEAIAAPTVSWITLSLSKTSQVERGVAEALATPTAPVHYVENALFTTLFGLLCWEAIFAPVPGAFFHPFHRGPADLYRPGFVARRAQVFERALARLEDGTYRMHILETLKAKVGRQSPFVVWGLPREILEQALDCIPAAHLRALFTRLLKDLKANRAGFPDLIQFDLERQSYRLIEVKGPGDRLQDNQKRWLREFERHAMPVVACQVVWDDASEAMS
ncbi:VRR-NUC domain-containing protein [Larsenimonas salina]|uniref:VRR-NUC domain-containing protein n=1 Tax=Larsenimonas salina TaxID=1295565 RepID=UPI00207326D0|nr:VRR-NUC domain-containing protein [Larsenimonas salina]MCM5704205.1 VRR-NUC domain-containing protein [Larsenimonas salina]